MYQAHDLRLTSPRKRRLSSGPYACSHRQIDVIDGQASLRHKFFRSRKLEQNRRHELTQVTITCASNFRFQNNGGGHDVVASPYQIRSCNTSGWIVQSVGQYRCVYSTSTTHRNPTVPARSLLGAISSSFPCSVNLYA
jgi:hypothetical protein